jgi:hypothetical protein
MVTTHEPLLLDKRKFCTVKDHRQTFTFISIFIFFWRPFEYGDGGIFRLLRWIQNLHQSTWDHNILYADRSSEDEQLLTRPLLRECKNTKMAVCSKLYFIFYFMERTHEPLHLEKWSFVRWKILDIRTVTWIIIFFDGAFEYGGFSKCWCYVWTNAELLCVELSNFE